MRLTLFFRVTAFYYNQNGDRYSSVTVKMKTDIPLLQSKWRRILPNEAVQMKIHEQIQSGMRYIFQIQSRQRFISDIFLMMASISPSRTFITDTSYAKYYQIQPGVRFILIQPNVWLLQLFQYGLAYDPFGFSSPQILLSVQHILKCSLAYDYLLSSDTA